MYKHPEEVLKKIWGYPAFRPLQTEIIQSLLSDSDILALLPTGGGKSLCYQVPAMCRDGLCLVISPLLALMKDQVDALKAKKIKAYAVNSTMSHRAIDIALDNCVNDDVKFLYVSPERLSTPMFKERFRQMKVNCIAIDEAHCISQWGYDFRPSYLNIAEIRELQPAVPFIALTATATKKVRDDIVEKLQLVKPKIFCASFTRTNLSLAVRKTEDKLQKITDVFRAVPGTGIVYVRSRNRARDISVFLNRKGYSAEYYHAGLSADNRARRQEAWIKNEVRIMVATNAFGMGIDKSDVRTVVHYDLPENLESYYQEAGRAGRDGKKSYAVILLHPGDVELLEKAFETAHPPVDLIRRVYQGLANYYKIAAGSGAFNTFDFDFEHFCNTYKLAPAETFHALKKLAEEGFIDLSEGVFQPARAMFQAGKDLLYDFQVKNARFDPFIKLMLRLYGAELFNNLININPQKMARMLNLHSREIEKMLQNLHNSSILMYEKAHDKPQITFLTPRYDARELPLNLRQMKERKELKKQQLQWMVKYATQDQQCRALFMNAYFDENSKPCGKCDICLAAKNTMYSIEKHGEIKGKIYSELAQKPCTMKELSQIFEDFEKEAFTSVIRELLDAGELFINTEGRIDVK
ncbi:MAG: RecQ family ATP-dependent DNA helicase [Cyclobacteriaceae bacterium]|nr:RecQ family ATP-dependent DNA helicase [Cyclobacteriaceae bacterium]